MGSSRRKRRERKRKQRRPAPAQLPWWESTAARFRRGSLATQVAGGTLATVVAGLILAGLGWSAKAAYNAIQPAAADVRIDYFGVGVARDGAVEGSVLVGNHGGAAAYGCQLDYGVIDPHGRPLEWAASQTHPDDAWALRPGAERRLKVTYSGIEDSYANELRLGVGAYVEAWVECSTPRVASASRFFTISFPRRATWIWKGLSVKRPTWKRCTAGYEGPCDMKPLDFKSVEVSAAGDPIYGYDARDRVWGTGEEPLSTVARFPHHQFAPKTALVFATEKGVFLVFFEKSHSCFDGVTDIARTSLSRWIEVTLVPKASDLLSLPANAMLDRTSDFEWDEGNTSHSILDVATRVMLTRIDTHVTGVWHGRISVSDPNWKGYHLEGSFAATFCV